jgi:hypothetical protein
MPKLPVRLLGLAAASAGLGTAGYVGLVTGAAPLDIGLGRRIRSLGPRTVEVEAPAETVFDVIAEPYLHRTTRAMQNKVQVLERGADMVLAAHFTPAGRLTAKTVETVRFSRPDRVDFRLVRGPVPHVVETFTLQEHDSATVLDYSGELGTDGGAFGARWGVLVARQWEQAVAASFASIKIEAERRAEHDR